MSYSDVVDAIGHTPLVRLRIGNSSAAVYAKLEMQNLFGMKDRVARQIILDARRSGLLTEGAPIIESSSGTMALGVALVGGALGHEVHIVTDPRIDPITLAKLRTLGATVHIVEQRGEGGWQGARLDLLETLMKRLPGAFWPQQYSNPQNPAAYRTLADELLNDLGPIDVLVGSVGSGGSLCGTARALRPVMPGLRVVAVDCVGSMLFGQPDVPARLQSGLGNSLMPANLDHALIDEIHWLNDREAFDAARCLAREQQLFGGNTSGSVYRVLRHLAETAASGTRIVGILPDRGDRYHDTVYGEDCWQAQGLDQLPLRDRPQRVEPGAVVDAWSHCALPAVAASGVAAEREVR
ncbi:PLP-dependent cysteine synthase family protein [Streptomyces goshikiensis]|uniref:PLP-dependent cysteine synthase family protein n=1 Tax=Streptomyces goshikiensis TaxID=1942 RepID=UPI0036C9A672